MAAKKTTKRAPTVKDIAPKGKGTLVIVGGHEDKEGDKKILQLIADQAKGKKLVVATVATAEPEETWQEYRALFTELGVQTIEHLDVQTREQALSEECSRYLADAAAVFFTGGDQLKITSQLGDSMVYRQLHLILERGGTVAGTSAGASVMSTTMLISGPGDQSPEVQDAIRMAPGFGFLPDAVIDQHFAERGRAGRGPGGPARWLPDSDSGRPPWSVSTARSGAASGGSSPPSRRTRACWASASTRTPRSWSTGTSSSRWSATAPCTCSTPVR